MAKYTNLTCILCFLTTVVFSQGGQNTGDLSTDIFERVTKSVETFQLDTTAAPDDKMTRKIKQLRTLRGGFNINEAIDFKIEEDRQNKEIPKSEIEKLSTFFKEGDGKNWLNNAVIWIYREHFTYNEIKQLVKFYRTSAGQKMATDFPIIMMKSLKAAEMIKKYFVEK